eukprot:2849367-Amphidinium_carterae.1
MLRYRRLLIRALHSCTAQCPCMPSGPHHLTPYRLLTKQTLSPVCKDFLQSKRNLCGLVSNSGLTHSGQNFASVVGLSDQLEFLDVMDHVSVAGNETQIYRERTIAVAGKLCWQQTCSAKANAAE